ncbi:glutathione S-transferase Mu 1 [Trichonephila clavata]|uniref:glutathione transferase n=1 Tax=Trichonephila clavata TaxID=2740835 RepID=A0A8X6LH39_TRICU|nr:glutathione S-transferase Mu 1 [Trichonephila clavata]
MVKPILGYWDFRGYVEPIRFLLHYKKVDFEDKRYNVHIDDWLEDKFNLGLDFPNLPYYIEDDLRITQSKTIIQYLARKYGMDGKNESQKVRVSLADLELIDLRTALCRLLYSDHYEALKENFIKKIPDMMKQWETFLGDQKYLAGDNITYVDFMAYDCFDMYKLFQKNALDGCPNLQAYQKRMRNLPELQGYFNSPQCKLWPIFKPKAHFGGSGDPPKHL